MGQNTCLGKVAHRKEERTLSKWFTRASSCVLTASRQYKESPGLATKRIANSCCNYWEGRECMMVCFLYLCFPLSHYSSALTTTNRTCLIYQIVFSLILVNCIGEAQQLATLCFPREISLVSFPLLPTADLENKYVLPVQLCVSACVCVWGCVEHMRSEYKICMQARGRLRHFYRQWHSFFFKETTSFKFYSRIVGSTGGQ